MDAVRKKRYLPSIQLRNPSLSKLERDLVCLSEEERDRILQVLDKDANIRFKYNMRMDRLKSELSWMRKKGAIKAGNSDAAARNCGRCQSELGIILNRGAFCPSCGQKVCKQCREYISPGADWVCLVCRKQIEIQIATGEWMNDFIRRPSRRRGKGNDNPADLIKKALLKRSWTISSPSGVGREEYVRHHSESESPQKPQRRLINSSPSDENKPPFEYRSPDKPSRRYSMSSYDNVSTKVKCSRDSAPSMSSSPVPNGSSPYSSLTRRPPPPDCPKYYFFGADPASETQRPSTFPRKPHPRVPFSPENSTDPARFHSMPRSRPRSESGIRGRSEPPKLTPSHSPVRESYHEGRYVSSGPVTSTPIGNSTPRNRSSTYNPYTDPPPPLLSSRSKASSTQSLVENKEIRNRRSSRDNFAEYIHGDRRREDEGGGHYKGERAALHISNPNSILFDSGRSGSSHCMTPETSDAEEHFKKVYCSNRLPRSNTSISSGAATTGRPKKKPNPNSASVRRCRSFQNQSSSRPAVEQKTNSRGQVARYVQQLEKGIQLTVANMSKKASTLALNEPYSPSGGGPVSTPVSRSSSNSRRETGECKKFFHEEKQPSQISDNSSSDIVLDANKIVPGENDYKIVFISSDSSKESDLNSSIDSDNPATPPRKRSAEQSETDLTEFGDSDREDQRFIKRRRGLKNLPEPRRLVDAAVMTEEDFNSDEDFGDGGEDSSLQLSLRVPSPIERNIKPSYNQPNLEELPVPYRPKEKKDANVFSHPLETLGPQELRAMLQQTETVQAEAQALKKALMGAFEPQKRECRLAPKVTLPPNNRKSDNCHIGRSERGSKVHQETCFKGFPLKNEQPPNSVILSHDKKFQDSNIYENIEIMQQQHKNVFTQTDPEPFSDEESYETADDSDISSDSLREREDTPPPVLISPHNLQDKKAMTHVNAGIARKESNQDVSSPPFYLSAIPPPFPPSHIQSSPTTPHQRLTLNSEQHSVLLSSGGESVDRLPPRLAAEKSTRDALLVKSDQRNVNSLSKISDLSDASECAKKSLERCIFAKQKIHPRNERGNGGCSPSILVSSDRHSTHAAAPHLTNKTYLPFKSAHPNSYILKDKRNSGHLKEPMDSPESEKKDQVSGSEEGDVNATKKVICQEIGGLSSAMESCSSSASDEDTDEDVHISRSYDVSVDLVDKDIDGDNVNESACIPTADFEAGGSEKGSSTSDSETDDEKHSTGEYAVTKVTSSSSSSSDSEKENENNFDSALGNSDKSSPELLLEGGSQEAELPECDQALESVLKNSDIHEILPSGLPVDKCDIPHVSYLSSSNNDASLNSEQVDSKVSASDPVDEILDSVSENKSETESNIGLDADIQDLSSSAEVLTNGAEKNEEISKEDSEDLSSGESDREFVRLERELSLHDDENTPNEGQQLNLLAANNRDEEALPSADEISSDTQKDLQADKIAKQDSGSTELESEIINDVSSMNEDKLALSDKEVRSIEENLAMQTNPTKDLSPLSNEKLVIEGKESKENTEIEAPHLESSNIDLKVKTAIDDPDQIAENYLQENVKTLHQISNNKNGSSTTEITGSTQVEQESATSCSEGPVALDNLPNAGVASFLSVDEIEKCGDICVESSLDENRVIENKVAVPKVDSSESGESEKEESDKTVTIDNESEARGDDSLPQNITPSPPLIESSNLLETKSQKSQDIVNTTICSPPVPIRRAKRSSSSDGLSSSSDIDRSDADASDSADTIIDGSKRRPLKRIVNISDVEEDPSKDTDRPSSADSVLQGGESEYQGSDGSEEGNLISIVAVGDENPRKSSQGKIYIRSDSTDSDVQIKPTCIVVTGSSGIESGEEDTENDKTKTKDKEGNDVTILEVTSDHRKDHVMSVRVTSSESSRSTSPARNRVSELQSMILTTRESQQQVRCSPIEIKESSSLANYFTVTLGTSSPLTPRRTNKTPEIRRRKLKERSDSSDSPPAFATTPTPTLTPSPSHTPSPTLTPTPDHSEGDLLAYEENLESIQEQYEREDFSEENTFEFFDEAAENYEFEDMHDLQMEQDDIDITFDSIEDAESLGESNYSETSSEDGFERDEEIRGYAKRSYNFTLHTIIEESCEESDYEKRTNEETTKRDPSELEKYFYFGLGNGPADSKKFANEESEYSDTFSETSSSAFSEGMESLDQNPEEEIDPAELASSRLEKYFSGFLNFERQPSIRSVGEESEIHTDESGSVGSDSEGSASPEQPRKKLFKTRGFRAVSSSRSHGYSSDKGEGMISDGSHHSGEGEENDKTLVSGEDEISTESEEIAFEKSDGQFDTIKRRKKKKLLAEIAAEKNLEKTELKHQLNEKEESRKEINQRMSQDSEAHLHKISEDSLNEDYFKDASTNDAALKTSHNKDTNSAVDNTRKGMAKDGSTMMGDLAVRKYQSRDSGFIGSSDDLLKDKPEDSSSKDCETKEQNSDSSIEEADSKKQTKVGEKSNSKATNESKTSDESTGGAGKSESDKSSNEGKVSRSSTGSSVDLPPYSNNRGTHNLSRKDSFNNWSSDEETNLMMNKMRVFFKNMFSNTGSRDIPKGQRVKSPQIMLFEAKLTSLMRTVPGINDEQVKEIVEYLSSEETWSDSYDSSDYTSSDLEGAYARLDAAAPLECKSEIQEQISASCQQIIKKFDPNKDPIDMDHDSSSVGSKDTMFVYQKVFSSLSNMRPDSDRGSVGSGSQSTSPPLLAKVMHHIGNRFVALMHEVSAGSDNGDDIDSFNGGQLATSSPRPKLFLPKKHKAADSISFDSSLDKSSLTSNSFESEESPTDTEQSPESENGTPKAIRQHKYSLLSEKSSGEDFTSIESQRTVFGSHEYSRPSYTTKSSLKSSSQRSLEERNVSFPQYYTYDSRNKDSSIKEIDDDKFDVREHVIGLPKMSRSNRRVETRKAKSQLNLEKIHQDDVKNTGERSESLGDLLDRVRSSDYSSSYEQLDSDSTLKASDSLDRHISSSSSNVRLNASSRGSLTTSSRGSLAASSRGSLNASSRGSLQGSSGPEEEEDKKLKKFSFLRHPRRSSVPESAKEPPQELRSTTLPRSNPAQILATGTMPRSQPSQSHTTRSSTGLFSNLPSFSPERHKSTAAPSGPPRSARYHAPGYRPPPSNFPPKRAVSTPVLRKDVPWHMTDESGASVDDGVGASVSASSASFGSLHRGSGAPYHRGQHQHPTSRGGNITSPTSSRAASPLCESLKGSIGRTSTSNASAAGSLASFENSPDEEEAQRKLSEGIDTRRSNLSSLGPKSRSESLASVCSTGAEGRYGAVPVMGELRVALQYNYKEGHLECLVLQCRDLSPVDLKRNRSDPYVKVYLLPDRSKNGKRKTKVKRHTVNPVFEETLKFTTPLSDLESRTLWLSVWHSDMFGRNDFLGEVMIPLSDALFDDSSPKWYSLQDRLEPLEDTKYDPVIIVGLKFVSPDVLAMSASGSHSTSSKRAKKSRGALQVRVKEANGLLASRPQSPPDPVCKGVLLPEKSKGSKHKTSVCRKTNNPKWNHTMTFDDVTLQELMTKSLELSVWDHDRFGGSEFLGGCRLNLGKDAQNANLYEWMDASGLESKLWNQMFEKPNLWVESSILLRTAMDRPIYSSSFTE